MSNDGEEFGDLSLDPDHDPDLNLSRQDILVKDAEEGQENDMQFYDDQHIKQLIENYSLSAHDLSDCSLRDNDEALPERGSPASPDQFGHHTAHINIQEINPTDEDLGSRGHFPQVNAPSLELSRNNTPRKSLTIQPALGNSNLGAEARMKYEKNLLRKAHTHKNQMHDAIKNAASKIVEEFQKESVECLREQNLRLEGIVQHKETLLSNALLRCDELQETIDLMKAEDDRELELLRGKIVQKAQLQRDKMKEVLDQREKELNNVIARLQQSELDNNLLKDSIESKLEEIVEQLEREKVVSSSYKSREFELSNELERMKREAMAKARQLESSMIAIQEKDSKIKELTVYLDQEEEESNNLRKAMHARDQQLDNTEREVTRLKGIIHELGLTDHSKHFEKPDHNSRGKEESMTDEERLQYEWQIKELNRQIGLLRSNPKAFGTQKSSDEDSQPLFARSRSTERTTEDKSEQCSLMQSTFRKSIEAVLMEAGATEATDELSLSELHELLCKTVRQFNFESQRSNEIEIENNTLNEENNRINDLLVRKDKEIEQVRKSLQAEVDKYRNMLQKPQPQPKEVKQSLRTVEHFRAQFVGSASPTKPETRNQSVQVTDEDSGSKTKSLEKLLKDTKQSLATKTKQMEEMERKLETKEEELQLLESSKQEEADLRRKLEQQEKKFALLSQDLASRDKKNIELYESIKKLKAENELQTLVQSTKLIKRPQSSHKKGDKRDAPNKQLQDSAEQLQADLRETKSEMEELYKKVDKFYMERAVLYQTLDQQLKRNRSLAKEINFLRDAMASIEAETQPQSLELEMLSNEETESLLEKILKRATNSISMQKRLRESAEFSELCAAISKSSSRR